MVIKTKDQLKISSTEIKQAGRWQDITMSSATEETVEGLCILGCFVQKNVFVKLSSINYKNQRH